MPATSVVAAVDSMHPARADYTCDGTDDQVEIQAAIDGLTSGRTHAEKVVVIGGFSISSPILLPAHTTFEIQGALKLADGSNCDVIQSSSMIDSQQDIRIQGGVIDGNKANNLSAGNGINGIFRQSHIDQMWIKNCREYGVVLYTYSTAGHGAHGSWETFIENSMFYTNEGDVHLPPYSTDNGISNNVLAQATNTSILSDAGYNLIESNHMWGPKVMIECRDSGHMIFNNFFDSCKEEAIIMAPSAGWRDVSQISNNRFYKCCYSAHDTYSAILFAPVGGVGILNTLISHNIFFPGGAIEPKHAIDESLGGEDSIIEGNQFRGIASAAVVPGSDSMIRNNWGFVTENYGVATLANGTTSIAVTHGLDITPANGAIVVTPLEAWGAMTQFYTGNNTATQFTIYANQDPTQDVDFAWKAIV